MTGRSKEGGAVPDDVRTQYRKDASDQCRVRLEQFGREQLKENRPPDQLHRQRWEYGARGFQVSFAAIELQKIERDRSREQAGPEPIWQEATQEQQDSKRQRQRIVETTRSDRSITDG